jgi:hypothetical protein
MTVDKVLRFKNPHEPQEGLKAPVAGVALIMDSLGGGVGKEDVQEAPPEDPVKNQGGDQAENFQVHLKIGILIFPPVIQHGTPQARDNKPLLPYYPGADMHGTGTMGIIPLPFLKQGAFPVFFVVFVFPQVMVAEHKKQGFVQAGYDEFQIIHGQVPGAEHQVYIGKSLLD